MANLVAESGGNKGQLSTLVEAICRNFRRHDEEELKKLVEWQKQMKTKSANKEKPPRPDVAFWFPPADVTSAAFLQNAMAFVAKAVPGVIHREDVFYGVRGVGEECERSVRGVRVFILLWKKNSSKFGCVNIIMYLCIGYFMCLHGGVGA